MPSLGLPCADLQPPQEEASLSSDDDEDGEPENMGLEDAAKEERKRAGLPELEHDALASAIATKMLTLDKTVCCLIHALQPAQFTCSYEKSI